MSLEYNTNIENKASVVDSDGVFRELGVEVPNKIKSRLKRFKTSFRCSDCNNDFPYSEMAKNINRPNGLDGRCKSCKAHYSRINRRQKRNFANENQTQIF